MTIVGRLMRWLGRDTTRTEGYNAVTLPPDFYDPRVSELARLEAENDAMLALYGISRQQIEGLIEREIAEVEQRERSAHVA